MSLLTKVKTKATSFVQSYKTEVSTSDKMSTKEILSYGMVEFGSNAGSVLIVSFVNVFLTMALGIDSMTIGVLMTVVSIIGYARGPLVNLIMDVTDTKWGRFKPYVVICLPAASLIALAFFANPFTDQESMKIVYVYITYILWDTIRGIGNSAYDYLKLCITRDDNEKKRFFAIARGLNVISGLIPSGMPIMMDLVPSLGISTRMLFVVLSVLMCAIGFFTTMMARNLMERVQLPRTKGQIFKNIKMVFKNKNMIKIWLGNMNGIISYTTGLAGTYVFIYNYGAYSYQTLIWTFAGFMAWAGLFLSKKLLNKFNSKTIMIAYKMMYVIGDIVLYLIGYGTGMKFIILLILVKMFMAFLEYCNSVATNMFNTDLWDHYEWKYGVRNEATTGLVGSWVTIPSSVLGPIIYGVIFTKIGFVSGAETQSESTMDWLFLFFTLGDAIISLWSIAPYFFIKLDKKFMKKVRSELRERQRRKEAGLDDEPEIVFNLAGEQSGEAGGWSLTSSADEIWND